MSDHTIAGYVTTLCMFLTFAFTALFLDTSAESYRKAEAACVSLNSHVKSWDMDIATCENSAKIDYIQYSNRKGN